MTTASGRPGTAGPSRAADPAGQTAEVCWFDTSVISLNRPDLAEMDAREQARAAAFVFPADRHRYEVAHMMLRRVLAGHLGTDPGLSAPKGYQAALALPGLRQIRYRWGPGR